MGGRGASSLGAALAALPDVVKKIVGRAYKPIDQMTALKTTNPNFKKGKEWRVNCQRCVYAFEMQRRGFKVEAQPNYQSPNDTFYNGGWRRGFQGQTWEGNLGSRNATVKQNIYNKMSGWGDGARAIVKVVWKGGKSGHVFNIEQENGRTIGYDAQTGKKVRLSTYLNSSMPSRTEISRVDNLTTPNKKMANAIQKQGG